MAAASICFWTEYILKLLKTLTTSSKYFLFPTLGKNYAQSAPYISYTRILWLKLYSFLAQG